MSNAKEINSFSRPDGDLVIEGKLRGEVVILLVKYSDEPDWIVASSRCLPVDYEEASMMVQLTHDVFKLKEISGGRKSFFPCK